MLCLPYATCRQHPEFPGYVDKVYTDDDEGAARAVTLVLCNAVSASLPNQ